MVDRDATRVCRFTLWTQSSKERRRVASTHIPVSSITGIDRDRPPPPGEGYSVRESLSPPPPLCYPPAPGSHNEPVKGMIGGWEDTVNPQ